jgi:hypothetical protein
VRLVTRSEWFGDRFGVDAVRALGLCAVPVSHVRLGDDVRVDDSWTDTRALDADGARSGSARPQHIAWRAQHVPSEPAGLADRGARSGVARGVTDCE